ncbi:hypothetical protein V9K67_10220 [Paraflavisolibacter sp. H34]|uniref:hypothetical protein n=1 Tax=Huijunlia imazamoxiresistens TaxID=3127457 RepID=UPI003016B06B
MRRPFLLLILLFFLVSCKNCSRDTAGKEPQAEEAEEQPEEQQLLQASFPRFLGFLAAQDPSFSAGRFALSEGGVIDSPPSMPLNEDQLRPFAPYLVYSPDSSKAVDLYSYNYVLVQQEGKQTLAAGNPDTEAALVDFKAGSRKRLLFSGPSVIYSDARWVNGNELLLAGAEEINAEQVVPKVWKLDLASNSLDVYAYPDTITAHMDQYLQQKFSK